MNLSDEPSRKQFNQGTHRIVDPETTLARVLPFARRMGVTRLAVLTGLDVTGIPVVAAVRPNSRSVAVHQGKGATLAAAKVSALMEAAESWHAENLALPLRLATCDEMAEAAPVVDVAGLPRADGGGPIHERLLWVEGRNLATGSPIWVPYELVSADYTAPLPPGAGRFQATTNGLASGNTRLEAVLHGLYELVERDAITLWHTAPPDRQDSCAVDPDTVTGAVSRGLLDQLTQSGLQVRIWDITTDVKLPAFMCLAASGDETGEAEPQFGAGCHADADVALSRALAEAAQARVTVISGARDDIGAAGYRPGIRLERQEAAARLMRAPPRRQFRDAPSCAGETLEQDCETALRRLDAAGLRDVAWVDLTRSEYGIPVVRVLIPGLEGPWTPPGGEYTQGARAHAALPCPA